jgi:hypothetical protein
MRAASVVLVLLAVLFAPRAALADCRVHATQHVALLGTADDPDVFVWDSRFRLRDYEGGTFDQMQALLPHAILVRPGTRANIEGCVPNFVQPKFEDRPEDAVGIVITTGPLRGQRGWVLGSAVRVLRPPMKRWRWRF